MKTTQVDICIYGGTAAGLLAALAAARAGCSVLVIEPSRWLGGMIGAGIRITTDCEYPNHVGGLTRELLLEERRFNVRDHWRGQLDLRRLWQRKLEACGVMVCYEHRIQSLDKEGRSLTRLVLEYAPPDAEGVPAAAATESSAQAITATVFIDASYEGDLLAAGGIPYTVGRESRATYNESLAGVRNVQTFPGIDAWVEPGNPASGLLPYITPEPVGHEGDASPYLIPFNFRFAGDALRAQEGAFAPPPREALLAPGHRELVNRIQAAGHLTSFGLSSNYSRHSLVNGSLPGLQVSYPDGSWPERARIWRTLIEHDRLYAQVLGRRLIVEPEQYPDTNGWPHQLYVRMARRMRGVYTMTQRDVAGQCPIPDPVGLAYYNVDIYPCRLLRTAEGELATEGETWELVSPGPYPVSYRALTPQTDNCANLLVPVCISASHVACASIRMEPTFMILGESAGMAAAMAVRNRVPVQQIDTAQLRTALLDAGQILEWDGQGYGPYWFNERFTAWWEKHPEEYQGQPCR